RGGWGLDRLGELGCKLPKNAITNAPSGRLHKWRCPISENPPPPTSGQKSQRVEQCIALQPPGFSVPWRRGCEGSPTILRKDSFKIRAFGIRTTGVKRIFFS